MQSLLTARARARPGDKTTPAGGRRGQTAAQDDSGVSREGASLTTGVGTPLYMAPEVLRRSVAYGPSADVWSFGVLVWEIATQARPDLATYVPQAGWRGPFLIALEKALTMGHRLPLDAGAWPPGLAEVVAQCWDMVPGNRPTFAALGDTLSAIAENLAGDAAAAGGPTTGVL